MALTLSKGARSALTLDPNSTVAADSLAGDIIDTTEFGKGWASAGLGSRANSLWTQAAKAGDAGREADRQALEMQARDIQQQTGQWAPRVSQVTDVRSLRDAADWASGAMGNLRTSVAPAVAGLAGGVAGALAAPVTGGVVNPVNAGFAAAAAAGYDMETDEAVAQAMNDPYIRSNHSYADILAASRVKGGINALLESAVPTVMGGKVLGTMGKGAVGRFFGKAATKAELAAAQAAERAGQQAIVNGGVMGAAKTVGKNVLEGGAGEFATEGTQNLVGQGAQNYLKGKDLTDFDYQSALNDAAAGGIAGAGMGVMGGAGEVGHAYAGAGKEAVNEIKQDPVGKAADFIADAGTKAGTGAAKAVDTLSKLVSSDYRAHDVLVNDRGGPEQQQAAAMQWAKAKLEDSTTSESERADAASFVEGLARGDENAWQDYKNKLTVNHFENQHVQGDSEIADEIATRLGEKSKASQMRASTRMYIESGALAPDKSPKLLETTADIWRKQGVDEKLLTATSDKIDSAQREMAIGLLGWVARGFKDVDGNVFIPESLVKRYGDKTGKMIQSAAKTAFQQGLIDHDVAKQVPEIMQQATLQYAEASAVHDAILNAIPDYARDNYSRQDIADLDDVLRYVAKHGTNKTQEDALLKVFGSKENIAQAMSKLPEEKSTYGTKVDTHNGEDYDSGLTVSEGGERVKYHGYNRTDKPFNLLHEGQAKAHATRMSTHQNDGAVYARSIGAHDAVLEQYGQEHEYLRKAEDDMMWRAIKKPDSTNADREAYMQHLDSLTTEQRRSQLKALNKSHKFIRVEQVTGDEIADKIRPDQVNSFRETRKPGSPHVTAAGGMIYLERKAQVDKDTGEAVGKDEDFLTSTHRLIQHAWGAEGKESDGRTLGDKGKGAKGVYESFLRGMAALVESDGSFTGRVGFKATPTSEIKWVTRNNLPRDLKLGSYTAADAKRQIIAERNDNRTYEGDGELVGDVIEEKPSDSDNIVPSEHRGEKPIYRNSDGSRQGLADDAIGAGYEGHAPRSDKAAEPVTAPLATVNNPEKSLAPTKSQIDALDKLESAKNWAVEKLRAGMPTFNKAVAGFTKDRVETLVNALKTFTALGPEGVKKQFGKTLSDSQASALLTRATIALRQLEDKIEALSDEGVVNDTEERSKLGEGERGQAAVERKSDGETGSAQVDKVGKPAVSNVGQTERTGSLGLGGILSVKQLDDAIYKEDFGKFDTVDKLQQLAEHTYQRSVELEQRDELTEREEGVGAIAGQLVFDAQAYLKNPDRSGTDFESFFEGVKHTEADVENFIKAMGGVKQSTKVNVMSAERAGMQAAIDHLRTLGGDHGKQIGALVNALNSRTDEQLVEYLTGTATWINLARRYVSEARTKQSEQSKQTGGVTLPNTSPYTAKDQRKSDVSTKFIGRGSNASSTAAYAKAWGDKANSGTYTRDDVVFVSAEGGRKGRIGPNSSEIKLAMQAGAKIVTDGASDRNRPYNVGEREVAEILTRGGYAEAAQGIWVPKQSTQTADLGTGKRATKAEQTAAKQHILDTIGDTVKGAFVKHFGDNSSGSWTPGEHENTIRIALNSDVLSTSYHESMHEFFDMLKKHGNEATVKLLERVASNEVLNRKIERLLEKHPEAAAQVRESPEEAAAFMYQFWQAGQLKLGQEVGGFFNKIKQFFAHILGRVSKEVRDEQQADAILQAFSRGDFKSVKGDTAVREASMAALKANTAQHDKVLDNLDKVGRDFTRVAGRVLFSAEAMLKGTKNQYMADVARMYNQEAGEAKGKEQSLFEGIKQQDGIWMNKLDNLLNAYKKEDLELAREALSKGVPAKDRIAKEIVGKIESFYKEMFDRYITPRDIRRLDEDGHWVKVTPRQNYFTRVWDTNAIQKNPVEFRDRLIQHHMKELVATAALANKEMADYNNGTGNYANLGPAARKEVEKAMNAFNESGKITGQLNTQTITPELVADAIVHRLLNSKGHVDLAESTSSLGITPVATSINRRSLSWINDELFDEFKSKDIANIMTSYVTSMVKRGEYTRVFGHGNQKLNDRIDSAVLSELGGEPLVKKAKDVLPLAIQQWKKAKAKALKDKVDFDEPFPTLRAVGQRIHSTQVGQEKALADLKVALKSLDQGFKAIMAMDGTLGAHISQGHRALNNMMMTYQTLRLLPLVTFSSVNDVMGIVANGGELHDAWDALVAGMREIRLRWSDQKTNDKRAMRAESWGTVDAGSFLDNLGQTYGSMYMSDKARRFSNAFFKWNGMEGWNRAMRITATAVAERAIKAYKTEGFDKTDKAAVARFEALFGKGFKAEDIAVDENGDLDLNDLQNQAAVMHWVSSAIMSPNASHRTIWGSDLRMAPFWMLKQFAYTFHRVMLKGAIEQAKLGNFRPAMVLVAGYAPITIAADAVKEMLIPGDEPPWMKGGLDGYLAHAYDRSGIFGVPGMSYDALTSYDGPVIGALDAIGGPSVSQATNAMFDSVGKTALSAAPFGSLLRRAAD